MGEKITIISQNKLTIDGDVHGDIHGRQVVIGEEGSVIGTVNAEAIEVRGGIKGAIRAATVTLHPTAQVEGDITHQTLSISEGAQFDGRVRRAKDPGDLKPNLDVSASKIFVCRPSRTEADAAMASPKASGSGTQWFRSLAFSKPATGAVSCC